MARHLERLALAVLGGGARTLRRLHAERALQAGRDAVDALFVRSGRPPLRTHVAGVELRGFLRHRSFLADLASDEHEPFLREVLLGELHPESLFVDVGAHVGLYTLLAADRVSRVVAFEADPYTARALAANVARAGARNVEVVAKAASDRSGTVGFWQSSGTYSSSLVHRHAMTADKRVEVEATTIDAEIGRVPDLVVKVDAEGAEVEVLTGLTQSLAAAHRAVLVVEVNPEALAEAGRSPGDLIAKLRTLGLELARIDETSCTIVPLELEDTGSWKGNLLCRLPSRS